MNKIFFVQDLEELNDVAKQILNYSYPRRKFAFYGGMGVGKTSLIKSLSLHLGVQDIVSSPTFSIVNEYLIGMIDKVYHFDFYRIKDDNEAYDIGYEEYFDSDAYCFIEWPDRIINLLEKDIVKISMSIEGEKRKIEIII